MRPGWCHSSFETREDALLQDEVWQIWLGLDSGRDIEVTADTGAKIGRSQKRLHRGLLGIRVLLDDGSLNLLLRAGRLTKWSRIAA